MDRIKSVLGKGGIAKNRLYFLYSRGISSSTTEVGRS